MARGWESKNVEEQQSGERPDIAAAQQTAVKAAQAARSRDRQALEMQRERILSERTSNPHRRAALQAALAEVEAKVGQG